jgi:hypothetical protein
MYWNRNIHLSILFRARQKFAHAKFSSSVLMGLWVNISLVVFFLLFLTLIVLNFLKVRQNGATANNQILYPFSATIDPTTGTPSSFTTVSGGSQITCPAGSSVNIVGAFFNVFDPYNECVVSAADVSPLLANCTDPNVCPGQQGSGPNGMCTPTNMSAQCAIRDASASVGAKCNGRQSCPDLTMADFGDYPCAGIAPTQCINSFTSTGQPVWSQTTRSGYCALPYIPGNPGGVPVGASTQNSNPANANVGYIMHGIYTCVPNSE